MNKPLGGGDIVRPLANNLIRPPLFSEILRSFSLGYSGNGMECAENCGNKLRAAKSTSMATALAIVPLFHTISHFLYYFWLYTVVVCCFYTTDVGFLLTF